jgi:AcrR family transcriptional regulator
MKDTFLRLSEEKREKIIQACIDEFGSRGYKNSSTDRIIRKAGISKGGLYEYISSKKELFLYIVEYSYKALYDYLREQVRLRGEILPPDILERFRLIASLAFDFYQAHPRFISLITKTHQLTDPDLIREVESCFKREYLDIFGDCSMDGIAYPADKVLKLLTWLLLRTRYEFLSDRERGEDGDLLRKHYMENWDFYISVLSGGIYR